MHGWCTRIDDVAEHTPPLELEDAAAHQRVCRERVGSVGAAFQHQDALSLLGEKHRGRGAGDAATDDDRVVAGEARSHFSLL